MNNKNTNVLTTALVPGILSGVIVVIMSVSLAALVFSGRLAGHIAEGIALAINTAIIAGLGIAFFSSCKPVISIVDEDTAPVFALLASFIVAAMPASATGDQLFITAVAAIVFTTVIGGIGLFLLGVFRFGKFIQFLPHSVMGGYFAAVGWLLVIGGLKVSSGLTLSSWDAVQALVHEERLVRWLPAIAISLILFGLRKRVSSTVLLPATVFIALVVWHIVLANLGVTPADAMRGNFLIGPFGDESARLLKPMAGIDFGSVNWGALFSNIGTVASVFLIAVMSMMLSISGLGFLTRTEPDMNSELKVAGLSNVASGFGGGMIGLPSYGISALAVDMGGKGNRWVGVLAIVVCTLVFLFGLDYVAYTPKFILSGILIYLGLSLLTDWLVDGRQKFSGLEYLVIPIILLVSIFAGFLQGVLIGLVAAIVLFVVKYSRVNVVRFAANGRQLMSNVDRISAAQDILYKNGERLLVLGLQGYLFFGTAGQVLQELRERIQQGEADPLDTVIIDFSQVTGLDASAALNFQKIQQLASSQEFRMIMAGLAPQLRERLEKGGFEQSAADTIFYQPDLDRSLEWYEKRLLSDHGDEELRVGCFEQLRVFLSDDEISTLKRYMQKQDVDADHVLAEQGDLSDQLFFLESCAASAYITSDTGDRHRVRRTLRGTVFGELGFYLQIPRTASVVTDGPGLVYVLDRESLLRMEDNDPEVAAGLNRYMAILLSERLMFTTRTLRAFLM